MAKRHRRNSSEKDRKRAFAALADPPTPDIDDEDSVAYEMGKALDIDPDDLNVKPATNYSGFGVDPIWEVTIRGGRNKKWHVVADDDAERELALAIVKQDLEQEPEIFEKHFIEGHIDEKKLRDALWSDTENMLREDVDQMRDDDFWEEADRYGMDVPEENEDGELPEPSSSEQDELAEKMTEERLKDPLECLEEIYGKEDAVKQAIDIAGIDVDAAAEEAVNVDGASHFLSSYDGQSHETHGGFVYWRTN